MSETTTLELGGAQITVGTHDLFRAWLEKHLLNQAAVELALPIPVFKPQPKLGERYVGSIIEPDFRMRHIFLLPQQAEKNWKKGLEWAKELGADLPDRVEQAMLYAYMKEEFEQRAYWSNTQHAGNSNYAWYQLFVDGNQYNFTKSTELAVCAVRREFSDSVIQ